MKLFLHLLLIFTLVINSSATNATPKNSNITVHGNYAPIINITVSEIDSNTKVPTRFGFAQGTTQFFPLGLFVIMVDVKTGDKYVTAYRGQYINDGDFVESFDDLKYLDPNDPVIKDLKPEPIHYTDNGTQIEQPQTDPTIDYVVDTTDTPTISSDLESAVTGAVGSALGVGLTYAIYEKVIFDKDMHQMKSAIKDLQAELTAKMQNAQDRQDKYANEASEIYQHFIQNFPKYASFNSIPDLYQFESPKSAFKDELVNLRKMFNSVLTFENQKTTAKNLGLMFTKTADHYYAEGDFATANAFKGYANWMADMLFGLDPITGPIRDIYESFSGKNIITGEQLTDFERTFAFIGICTFGLGSKISKVLEGVSKANHFIGDLSNISNKLTKAANAGLLNPVNYINGKWNKFDNLYKHSDEIKKLFNEVFDTAPSKLFHYSDLVDETKDISIASKFYPNGVKQDMTKVHLDAYEDIKNGNHLVARQGGYPMIGGKKTTIAKFGDKPQFWSYDFDELGTVKHNFSYGAYTNKVEFIEYGGVKPGAQYVTRAAPPGVLLDGTRTPGGAIEVVVEQGGVISTELKDLTGTVE